MLYILSDSDQKKVTLKLVPNYPEFYREIRFYDWLKSRDARCEKDQFFALGGGPRRISDPRPPGSFFSKEKGLFLKTKPSARSKRVRKS